MGNICRDNSNITIVDGENLIDDPIKISNNFNSYFDNTVEDSILPKTGFQENSTNKLNNCKLFPYIKFTFNQVTDNGGRESNSIF